MKPVTRPRQAGVPEGVIFTRDRAEEGRGAGREATRQQQNPPRRESRKYRGEGSHQKRPERAESANSPVEQTAGRGGIHSGGDHGMDRRTSGAEPAPSRKRESLGDCHPCASATSIPATAGPPARRGQLEKQSQPQVGNPLSRFRNALGGIADTGRERTTLDVRYEISKNGTSGSIADPEAGPRKISHMEE